MKSIICVLIIISFFAKVEICRSGQPGHGFIDTVLITDDSSIINAYFYDSYSSSAVPLVIIINDCQQTPRCAFEIVNAFADRFCWGRMTEIPNCPHFIEFDLQGLGESTSSIKAMIEYVKKILNESELSTLNKDRVIDLDVSVAFKKSTPTRIDTSRIYILGVSKDSHLAVKMASKLSLISKSVIVAPIRAGDGTGLIQDVKNYNGKVLIITDARDSASSDFANQLVAVDSSRIESKKFIPGPKAIDMVYNRHEHSTEESLNYLIDWIMDIKKTN